MTDSRICVFIDGGNFYHLVAKKLNFSELDFNFDEFVKFLIGERNLIKDGKRYYIGTVREKNDGHKSLQAMSRQTKLFTNLIATNWIIKTSKLRTRVERIKIDKRVENFEKINALGINEIVFSRSREKGIDVKIAVDLIVGAIDNKYDAAIIVSFDTDLVPAIDWVRNRQNKKVEYIGFSVPSEDEHNITRPTKTLIYKTDIQRVLIEDDLKPFIK